MMSGSASWPTSGCGREKAIDLRGVSDILGVASPPNNLPTQKIDDLQTCAVVGYLDHYWGNILQNIHTAKGQDKDFRSLLQGPF